MLANQSLCYKLHNKLLIDQWKSVIFANFCVELAQPLDRVLMVYNRIFYFLAVYRGLTQILKPSRSACSIFGIVWRRKGFLSCHINSGGISSRHETPDGFQSASNRNRQVQLCRCLTLNIKRPLCICLAGHTLHSANHSKLAQLPPPQPSRKLWANHNMASPQVRLCAFYLPLKINNLVWCRRKKKWIYWLCQANISSKSVIETKSSRLLKWEE